MLKDFISVEDSSIDELLDIRCETDDDDLVEMIDDIIFEREEYSISYDEIANIVGGDY